MSVSPHLPGQRADQCRNTRTGALGRWVTRLCLLVAVPVLLAGCGFALRQHDSYAFETIAISPGGSAIASVLKRYLGDRVRPVVPGGDPAQVTVDVLSETQTQTIAGTSSAGLVREFLLQSVVRFRFRDARGQELLPATEIQQQRFMTYNETYASAKGEEAKLMFDEMRQDLAQQILNRLAKLRPPEAAAQPASH